MDHGFSTRKGGESSRPYSALNLGFLCGDEPDKVGVNRRRFFEIFGLKPEKVFTAKQVHGKKVLVVDHLTPPKPDNSLPEVDGLITARSGVGLATSHADCVPIVLVDPVNRVIAAVHAGWRGTLAAIVGEAVCEMRKVYGSKASDLLAAIGPSIGKCCYEVSPQLYETFKNKYSTSLCLAETEQKEKTNLDLPQLNKEILIEHGLLPERIDVSGLCTSCRPEEFFSHRRDQGKTGRHLSLALLT